MNCLAVAMMAACYTRTAMVVILRPSAPFLFFCLSAVGGKRKKGKSRINVGMGWDGNWEEEQEEGEGGGKGVVESLSGLDWYGGLCCCL